MSRTRESLFTFLGLALAGCGASGGGGPPPNATAKAAPASTTPAASVTPRFTAPPLVAAPSSGTRTAAPPTKTAPPPPASTATPPATSPATKTPPPATAPTTSAAKPATPPAKPPAKPAPSATEAARYDFLATFVRSHGGTFLTAAGHMNLVGMRKDDHVGKGAGSYHDVLYAVWKDSSGTKHVARFRYTTEPAQDMRYDANDANGDGSRDLGRIPVGFYTYAVSRRSNGDPCLRPTKDFRVECDIDHDGSFTEHYERSGGDVFLFHRGGNFGTGSAGCQTFPPTEWTRFWNTVRHAPGSIGYTLTTKVPPGY